ncbi:uncharacterized protein C2845_PM05G17730 [Panicum miliaceum]|uniref:Translation initiation factor beta propellor-like domain-containing protein n=1 Tax=Panicum miliaceum TaxID=4540 RepID=A0A3L6ST70_PANMI|nr:uncharacterized protein C2845_PM05G17730 [Panicum miliaceum]
MYWQSNGEYLAVQVDRYTKTKSTYTGFELFIIKERDIPIKILELDNKNDKIIAFAWEPKGHHFAVIHGDGPNPDISFYCTQAANTSHVSKLTTLKSKLEFYNVDELQTIAAGEYFMATDIKRDPTGRYVATVVTAIHEMENGFQIWSFSGKLLCKLSKDHLYQFSWRPRPLALLAPEKEEITRDLTKYSKYELEDRDASNQMTEQERMKWTQLEEEWAARVAKWKQLNDHFG